MMEEMIDQKEIDERISILRRFRCLLEQQRNKFQEYLHILEMQESEINSDNTSAITAHAELENQIVKNIGSLQKIIVPMQRLYETSRAAHYNPKDAIPVSKIQGDLTKLRTQVISQNMKNQQLLRVRMSDIRNELSGIKNPYRAHQSIYAKQEEAGTLVHMDA